MTYKKKTWNEKLNDNKDLPKTLSFERNFPCGKALEKWGARPGDSVVIAPPLDVDMIMKKVPKGKIITIYEICTKLAKKHKVDYCCSLTTGIFINIAANAGEEDREKGGENITPYWRTLKTNGVLNAKFPGGQGAQKKMLESEGFTIIGKGKTLRVKDFEEYLM